MVYPCNRNASRDIAGYGRLGVNDPSLVLHSLRHRAKDRLRAHEFPQQIQLWMLGHDLKTVSESYGTGPSMKLMKKWIDVISY